MPSRHSGRSLRNTSQRRVGMTTSRTPCGRNRMLRDLSTAACAWICVIWLAGCERRLDKPFIYRLDRELTGPVLIEIKGTEGSLLRETDRGFEIQVNAEGYGAITTADRALMRHWAPPTQFVVGQTDRRIEHWGGEAASTALFFYLGDRQTAFDWLYGVDSLERKLQLLTNY